MNYRLICFDAGFTLIEPQRSPAALLAAALARNGIAPTEAALKRAWEAADRWFWEDYQRPDNDIWVSDERIHQTWRYYQQLMLQALGIADPAHAIADAVIASHNDPANWRLYPDALPTLTALRQAGLKLGIVSDWGSQLPHIIASLGIDHLFDFILASATAGAAKPSATFYRMALDAAATPPSAALMVGDSYRADVQGARSAGMDALLLDRLGSFGGDDVPTIRALTETLALM